MTDEELKAQFNNIEARFNQLAEIIQGHHQETRLYIGERIESLADSTRRVDLILQSRIEPLSEAVEQLKSELSSVKALLDQLESPTP